jgi:hypothetical protein
VKARLLSASEGADEQVEKDHHRAEQEQGERDGADPDQGRVPAGAAGEAGADPEGLGVAFVESLTGHGRQS